MQDIKNGLNDEEVLKYRERYGRNTISQGKRKSFFSSFISNFSDPIIRVLIIALFINIIIMFPKVNWFEAGGIAVSILISTLVSTVSEYSNENAFKRLKEENESSLCIERRNGQSIELDSEEIVVNDIVILNPGMRIQADAKIISGEISVDESMLTGESAEISKNTDNPSIMKGSLVISGYATARVTAVGESTYYGKSARELRTDTRPSPLKHRLSVLARSISIIGYVASGLIAFAYLFNVFFIDSGMNMGEVINKFHDVKFVISSLLSALTLAVSVIVVAVPEGLPMMITVVLSSNMKRMMRDNVIVRKLTGIETSGNISLLFTDKTGTITEGVLRVKEVYTSYGDRLFSFNDIKDGAYKRDIFLASYYCGNNEINGRSVIASNPTDKAICEFIKRERYDATVISRLPFDSAKKYSSATLRYGNGTFTFFKGAPEKIINMSHSYMDKDGNIKELKSKEMLYKELKGYTSASYRVVALGMKRGEDMSLDGIVFLGFMAIRDRVRREVPGAIRRVNGAGVGVIMITGDNRDTAEAIAKECGIISAYSGRNLVLTGQELSLLDDKEVANSLDRLAVVARVLPSDKSRLVRIAQGCGYVVGMTGDGINDASSLKSADVGFAMGSGTEVAKEAGDIVIADNNFNSISKAILYGRTIFESIRKFIVFQLTMNLGAMGICLIGPFIGVENPVTVSQMLWVNIIMDTLGALAFASEPAIEEYMKNKPKNRDENILSYHMIKKILLNGTYILLVCIWFLKSEALCMMLRRCDESYILGGFFAMFCFMSIFVSFVSRTDRIDLLANISRNRSFILIMMLIAVVQIIFIYFGGATLRSVPLALSDLIRIVIISSSIVVFDLIRKILFVRRKTKKSNRRIYGGKGNVTE